MAIQNPVDGSGGTDPRLVRATLLPVFRAFHTAYKADTSIPPDLHLVIVEAPTPGHSKMERLPPLEAVRTDLSGKEPMAYWPDKIPTLPAHRFLYYGDRRAFGRFRDLAREAGVAMRSTFPDIDRFVTEGGWEGPKFIMPNLWTHLIPSIFEMTGVAGGLIERWRWGDDFSARMVPYEDDKLRAFADAERARGIMLRSLPSQEVNVTTFHKGVFECSCMALSFLIHSFGSEPDDHATTRIKRAEPRAEEAVREPVVFPMRETIPRAPTPSELISRDRPRARIQIAFLEYMADRSRVSYSEICDRVHGDVETSDGAIRTNVGKVNAYLAEKAIPISFVCGSGRVTKVIGPE